MSNDILTKEDYRAILHKQEAWSKKLITELLEEVNELQRNKVSCHSEIKQLRFQCDLDEKRLKSNDLAMKYMQETKETNIGQLTGHDSIKVSVKVDPCLNFCYKLSVQRTGERPNCFLVINDKRMFLKIAKQFEELDWEMKNE